MKALLSSLETVIWGTLYSVKNLFIFCRRLELHDLVSSVRDKRCTKGDSFGRFLQSKAVLCFHAVQDAGWSRRRSSALRSPGKRHLQSTGASVAALRDRPRRVHQSIDVSRRPSIMLGSWSVWTRQPAMKHSRRETHDSETSVDRRINFTPMTIFYFLVFTRLITFTTVCTLSCTSEHLRIWHTKH